MRKPLKISFLVSSLGGGSAEKMMLRLANYANTTGHSVDFLITRNEGRHLKKYTRRDTFNYSQKILSC